MQLQLDVAEFLRRYWQRRPLLIRQALPGFVAPVNGDDLAALAMQPEAIARLVRQQGPKRRYSVQHGPFEVEDFQDLPALDWTLLVQDVDKWLPEAIAPLLRAFRFLPDWRIEDVMISHAVPGGSVGAHIDQYDVFLLQAAGTRRWSIDAGAKPDCRIESGAGLRLLKQFSPTDEWDLVPGDLLYLPPGVPHHGVAVDTCLTYSIGLRAPAVPEVLQALASDWLDREETPPRIRDGRLRGTPVRGELERAAVRRLRRQLRRGLKALELDALCDAYARFLCGYRAPRAPHALQRVPGDATVLRRLQGGEALQRDPWQRLIWTRHGETAHLHGAGAQVALPIPLAERLCDDGVLDADAWAALDPAARRGVRQLLAAGALHYLRPTAP